MSLSNMFSGNGESYRKEILRRDIQALKSLIAEFNGKPVVVWHCCTPEGKGYYALQSDDKLRFVKSNYELELIGGAWSVRTWFRLYKAQEALNEYLQNIKSELEGAEVRFVIRQLYLPWIIYSHNLCNEEYDWLRFHPEIREALNSVSEYRERYQDEIKEYSSVKDWTIYYNREGKLYYQVQKYIQDAIDNIYKIRPDLEKSGLWMNTRKMIDDLYDMVYTRRKYENWL